jgi:hypothetical protein
MAAIDDAIAITQSIADRRIKVNDQHVIDMLAELSGASQEEIAKIVKAVQEKDAETIGQVIIKRVEAKRRVDADTRAAQVWADGNLNPNEFLTLFGR